MADVKISALPAATTPLAGTEVLPIVQSSTTKKVSVADLTAGRAISASSITNSALTSGRVTYAGASGLLSDNTNFVWDNTNERLGVGISTPVYKLHVNTTFDHIHMTNPTTGTTGSDGFTLDVFGTSARLIQRESASMEFYTAATERMRITSTGAVGIGTSSPSQLLHLNVTSGSVYEQISSGANNVYVGFDSARTVGTIQSNNALTFDVGSSYTPRMTIDTSGNLGIGTSSPAVTLHASASVTNSGGTGTEILRVANTRANTGTSGASISFVTNEIESTNQYIRGQITGEYDGSSNVNGRLLFATANTSGTLAERMRITSTGLVGIGTSSPNQKLTLGSSDGTQALSFVTTAYLGDNVLIGNIEFSTNSASGGYDNLANIQAYKTGTNTNSGDLTFLTKDNGSSAVRMRIASGGVVTMSSYGAGAATFSASGVISSVSDETWKTKDGVPTNTDAMLQKLEPGYWFYNEEKAPIFGEERQLGFYAQNVHEAIGEEAAPTPEEGKPWGYYDRSVLAVAVMSLKNALNTIEELKQRIETLENK